MSDDELSRPMSYGERRALEEQRKIDADRGKPFEDRDARMSEIWQTADVKRVRRTFGSGSQP
jgi:hypothetical protein